MSKFIFLSGKIIKQSIFKSDPYVQSLINKELAIAYHFDHPNVLRVHDLFCTSNKIYMFMEFCFGDLNEFISSYRVLPFCQSKE